MPSDLERLEHSNRELIQKERRCRQAADQLRAALRRSQEGHEMAKLAGLAAQESLSEAHEIMRALHSELFDAREQISELEQKLRKACNS
jgi:predicted  nucleic acid-binding Zn-ribbon protein